MKIPVGLKYKPVIVSGNYHRFDSRFSPETDAEGLVDRNLSE